jgi:predicted nucleotide-binding protein
VALTETETCICEIVVRRLLAHHDSTPRITLLRALKTSLSDPIWKLMDSSIIKTTNFTSPDERYLPRALSFYFCHNANMPNVLPFARQSTELMLGVIRNLFNAQLETDRKEPFSFDEAVSEARRIVQNVTTDEVWLGLYLANEFSVFSTFKMDEKQIGIDSFQPSENIFRETDHDGAWEKHIRSALDAAERRFPPAASLRPGAELTISGLAEPELGPPKVVDQADNRKVFLVHGRNTRALRTVSEFLKALGLEVVILYKQPNKGQTIIEKFEEHSDVRFAVVLLTPDDVGALARGRKATKKRARQNVILELGYFIGKLGRNRVCPLYVEGVEIPSDFHGVLYVPYDKQRKWRSRLATEISAVGIPIKVIKARNRKKTRESRVDPRNWLTNGERLVERVFGAVGSCSAMGEFKSWDYELVNITDTAHAPYDFVRSTGKPPKELNVSWWQDYIDTVDRERSDEQMFLVVSERPVRIPVHKRFHRTKRVMIKNLDQNEHNTRHVVFVDISNLTENRTCQELLVKAREILKNFATILGRNHMLNG